MVWLVTGVLFLVPFVDPRRPFRWLHLDLIVLLAFGAVSVGVGPLHTPSPALGKSIWVYRTAYATVGIGLVYVLVRMLIEGLRPRSRRESLVPLVPIRWLGVAALAMALFHVGYVATGARPVVDPGQASVQGADLIVRGEGLYDAPFSEANPNGNTYGPANYLLYVPFAEAFQSTDTAARAAALFFDLLTGVGLFLLGWRLGPRGRPSLGVALAFAWFSYPYALFAAAYGSQDALVAFLLVMALLVLTRPALSGGMIAIAAAVKFVPAAVAPLFATATGSRNLRSSAFFVAAFAVVSVALFLPFIPDGGLRELYDRTIGFQAGRDPEGSVWALSAHLHPAQVAVRVGAAALAILVAFVPRHKTPGQLAAFAAAVLVSLELGLSFWVPLYIVWFAPFAFLALFLSYEPDPRPASPSTRSR